MQALPPEQQRKNDDSNSFRQPRNHYVRATARSHGSWGLSSLGFTCICLEKHALVHQSRVGGRRPRAQSPGYAPPAQSNPVWETTVHLAVAGGVFDGVFLCCTFFPLDVLDEIWDVIESVSEEFLTYSC